MPCQPQRKLVKDEWDRKQEKVWPSPCSPPRKGEPSEAGAQVRSGAPDQGGTLSHLTHTSHFLPQAALCAQAEESPQSSQVEVLTPSTSEDGWIWRKDL